MTCDECHFFRLMAPWLRSHLPGGERFGECRRNPPVLSHWTDQRPDRVPAVFPTVKASYWCGEFAPCFVQVDVSRHDEANAAFDAASQEDATVANVGAVTRRCQSGRKTRAPGRD